MRIIAGSFRGQSLKAPEGRGTRPTSDRVREALFSILGDIEGLAVLDLYAGSGALGLEALSRGAADATFVEEARPALQALRANVAALAVADRVSIVAAEAGAALQRLADQERRFGLVFLDPPYARAGAPETLADLVALGLLVPGAWVVVEHASRDAAPATPRLLERRFERAYGDTMLTFHRFASEAT